MDSVLRAATVYFFLLILFRAGGERNLAQITVFDFILLLIIGAAAKNVLVGEDYSFVNAMLVIFTLFIIDIAFDLLKQKLKPLGKVLDGTPLVLVDNGELLKHRLTKVRIGEEDILEEARKTQGLERMEQIKYAVLERNGGISIIPRQQD
jgi:uncharacterized membrane protein YcaP (DUF421 family)